MRVCKDAQRAAWMRSITLIHTNMYIDVDVDVHRHIHMRVCKDAQRAACAQCMIISDIQFVFGSHLCWHLYIHTLIWRARQWAGEQNQSLHQPQTHKSASPTSPGLPKETMTRLLTLPQNQGVLAKPQASPRAPPPPRLARAASLSVHRSAPVAVAAGKQGASFSVREGRRRDSPGRGHSGSRGRANGRIPSDEISDMYHSVLEVEAEFEDLASVPKP